MEYSGTLRGRGRVRLEDVDPKPKPIADPDPWACLASDPVRTQYRGRQNPVLNIQAPMVP